jgi:multisubunit Na+/H+ antiporter MnhB subunit
MSILAVFFPWLVLLIYDNPGGAFVALVMQATVVGWPFATIWAWKFLNNNGKQKNNN